MHQANTINEIFFLFSLDPTTRLWLHGGENCSCTRQLIHNCAHNCIKREIRHKLCRCRSRSLYASGKMSMTLAGWLMSYNLIKQILNCFQSATGRRRLTFLQYFPSSPNDITIKLQFIDLSSAQNNVTWLNMKGK